MKRVSKIYQVVVFTASIQPYADAILDIIDPRNEYITKRIYREHCIQYCFDGPRIKDLRIFANKNIKDVILVDNSPHCYIVNKDNGIPIIPFYDNRRDQELNKLLSFLIDIADVNDVRPVIKDFFKNDLINTHLGIQKFHMLKNKLNGF